MDISSLQAKLDEAKYLCGAEVAFQEKCNEILVEKGSGMG